MQQVPFLDLKAMNLSLETNSKCVFTDVLHSGWFILGKNVGAFEEEYAKFSGTEHAIGVAIGLDALHIALKVLGVGAGDEVIVPSNTYIATMFASSFVALLLCLSSHVWQRTTSILTSSEAAITPRTKVIIYASLRASLRDGRNYGDCRKSTIST